MKWKDFLDKFANRPFFHSSMLEIFPDKPHHIQIQLSRWVDSGKLDQIRRGWYLIRKPYRSKEVPAPFIANRVVHPSYLSTEWALQYYEMIPEYVPNPTSVTTAPGIQFSSGGTLFIYYHVQPSFFCGYTCKEYYKNNIFVALPEKALMDKIYLFIWQNRYSLEWLKELRLQNMDKFDCQKFLSYTEISQKPGLLKAAQSTVEYIQRKK